MSKIQQGWGPLVAMWLVLTCGMAQGQTPEPVAFREVWAYVLAGEESLIKPAMGITDLASFGAGLNSWGELVGVPKGAGLRSFSGRKHLVVAIPENQALTHMALFPEFPVRRALLAALIQASETFDGVQLDFEAVPARDKTHFWSFLAELRAGLRGKVLSIAVPARTSATDDAYDYRKLGALVDRVIVMAYDEHWSGSGPGSVASLEWCRKVAAYSLATLPAGRVVMGAPFYGRAWADKSLSRAYKYSGVAQLLQEKGAGTTRVDGIPSFEYEEIVRVKVYFEDRESQWGRLSLYAALGVRSVAFWRLGQEDPSIWSFLMAAPEVAGTEDKNPL